MDSFGVGVVRAVHEGRTGRGSLDAAGGGVSEWNVCVLSLLDPVLTERELLCLLGEAIARCVIVLDGG